MFLSHFLIHCFQTKRQKYICTHTHTQTAREKPRYIQRDDVCAQTEQMNNRICPLAMTEMNKRFHPHRLFFHNIQQRVRARARTRKQSG